MKCPYRNFEECIVNECPSCNYEIKETKVLVGKAPYWMDDETAKKEGYCWEETRKTYLFKSCKLIDNNVQPVPKAETKIINDNKTDVRIFKSIF